MKKVYTLICLFCLCGTTAWSQMTGGSAGKQSAPSMAPAQKEDKGVFDNAFYLRVGRSAAVGSFGRTPDFNTASIEDMFNGVTGTSAGPGVLFEMGLLSYIHSIPLQDQFKVGIDVSTSFSYNDFQLDPLKENWDEIITTPFVFLDLRVGPAFSYNPIDKVILDGYLKFAPTLCVLGSFDLAHSEGENYYDYSVYSDQMEGTFLRKSLGMNVRWNAIVLGLEYNWGKLSHSDLIEDYYENTESSWESSPSDFINTFDVTTPIKTVTMSVGVKF